MLNSKKISKSNPRRSLDNMAKTHWCFCERCDAKLVSKSTFYRHNPVGAESTGTTPQGIADTVPSSKYAQGGPPLRTPVPGPSADVISDDDTELPGRNIGRSARSDYVRVIR